MLALERGRLRRPGRFFAVSAHVASPWEGNMRRNCKRESCKAIANARLGEYIARIGRVGFQLMAQTVDIHAKVLGFTAVFRSPDTLQQYAMSEHLACIVDQLLKKSELDW